MFNIPASIAEFESDLRAERQAEGIQIGGSHNLSSTEYS